MHMFPFSGNWQQSIDISCRAHSSKPAATGLLLWAHGGTDRQTDTAQLHRPCSTHCAVD